MTRVGCGFGFVIIFLTAHCKKSENPLDSPLEIITPKKTPEANLRKIDPATTGVLQGTVSFSGTTPKPTAIPLGGVPECKRQHKTTPLSENVVVSTKGELQNVFVYLQSGLEDYLFEIPSQEIFIDQKGCIYSPHVVGVQVKQPVTFINSDAFLHNVHTHPEHNRSDNFSMPSSGMRSTKTFSKPEVMVRIKCDVHPWMEAFIGVLPHPYFAVTKSDGRFNITNIPVGSYTLKLWHETLGEKTTTVVIKTGETTMVGLTYKS